MNTDLWPKKSAMLPSLREHPDVSPIPGTKNIYKGYHWINASRHYKLKGAVLQSVRESGSKPSCGICLWYDSGKYLMFAILSIIGKEIISTKQQCWIICDNKCKCLLLHRLSINIPVICISTFITDPGQFSNVTLGKTSLILFTLCISLRKRRC